MAKISANGATKLAERRRVFTRSDGCTMVDVAVLCSDGRILTRAIHFDGTSDSYVVAARARDARQKSQTALLDIFHSYCDRRKYEPRAGHRNPSRVDVYQSGSRLESSHTA